MAVNHRQERFAEILAAGSTVADAFTRAGYTARTRDIADENGARLLRNPAVKALYTRLRQQHAAAAGLTAQRVMDELRAVALSDIDDYSLAPDGSITLKDHAHPLARRAVASKKFTVTRKILTVPAAGGEPGTNVVEVTEGEIKLWPKVEALKLAAQVTGLTKPEEQAVTVEIDQVIIRHTEAAPPPVTVEL